MRKFCLVLFLLINASLSNAQTVTGNIDLYLNDYVSNIPGRDGNNYIQPTLEQLDDWGNLISEILNGNMALAKTIANSFNYQIIEFIDSNLITSNRYFILEEKVAQNNYWGTYVFNTSPCRDGIVIQAPHPKYDINTASQAIYSFTRLSARILFLSGTHRCNHTFFSNCDGTTTACSESSSAYRISDMAHNTLSAFQKTTEVLNAEIDNAVFIQLHGFTKLESDPYVIISNGTRDTPFIDYISQIKNELYFIDSTLTFKIPHIDLSWVRLVGFTNTQGRLLNGSLSPCNTSIDITTGKFIHIEQEKTKLRDDSIGWHKLYTALSNTFSCNTLEINDSELNQELLRIYPNPIRTNFLSIEAEKIKSVKLFDINAIIIFSYQYNYDSKIKLDLSSVRSGIYFLTIQTEENKFVSKLIRH